MRKLIWLFVWIGIFSFPECVKADILKDMVAVDRAYIPTVYYVKQGDVHKSKWAMLHLQHQWQNLATGIRKAYYGKDWGATFYKIEGHLNKATKAIVDQDLYWAQCHLENARFEWNDLRHRYDMTYLIDYAYEFQMSWDIVRETVSDPVLCWLEWQEFEAQVEDAEKAIHDLVVQEVDWALFQFEEEQKVVYQLNLKNLKEKWAYFKQEMECAHRENIAVTAIEVSHAFDQFLNQFGAFDAPGKYYAEGPIKLIPFQ